MELKRGGKTVVLFIYGRWDKFELDIEYDEKQGKRKFFGVCDTDKQEQVNNLIEELICNEESVNLFELYENLKEVSKGEIGLESFLQGVSNVLDDLIF